MAMALPDENNESSQSDSDEEEKEAPTLRIEKLT